LGGRHRCRPQASVSTSRYLQVLGSIHDIAVGSAQYSQQQKALGQYSQQS
jgi:hypothetical protein